MGDTVLFPWRLQMDNNRISAFCQLAHLACMHIHGVLVPRVKTG